MTLERAYFLPLSPNCPQSCSYCKSLGFLTKEKKQPSDFERSLDKAVLGNYFSVLLPCSALFEFDLMAKIELILSRKLKPILQVNTQSLNQTTYKFLEKLTAFGCHFNFLIHDDSPESLNKVIELESKNLPGKFALVLRKDIQISKLLSRLSSETKEKLYFYLPHRESSMDDYYNCRQLYKLLRALKEIHPDFNPRPVAGFDQYDPRIAPNLELEPMASPELVNMISDKSEILISVIIPTYNNETYIQNTIRHIANQNLNKRHFELIVVNDGSSDKTAEKIVEELQKHAAINYQYIFLPRPRKRFMGDAQFRAGIARNLGVKWARGRFLSFLDADIITPSDYLSTLLEELKSTDVIQAERHYLRAHVSTNETRYEDMDILQDTFIPEKGYWHEFYNSQIPWNEMPHGWKFVCTYSLTLGQELFKSVGWFRKTYMFYGFEDTDLGYRLFKENKKFKLSRSRVLHLCQNNERSEYSNSDFLRQAILSKTARIFYKNYLDQEIYQQLEFLINEGPGLDDLLGALKRVKVNVFQQS